MSGHGLAWPAKHVLMMHGWVAGKHNLLPQGETYCRCVHTQQLGQAWAIGCVLNDAQLDGAPKLLPEGAVLLALLCDTALALLSLLCRCR